MPQCLAELMERRHVGLEQLIAPHFRKKEQHVIIAEIAAEEGLVIAYGIIAHLRDKVFSQGVIGGRDAPARRHQFPVGLQPHRPNGKHPRKEILVEVVLVEIDKTFCTFVWMEGLEVNFAFFSAAAGPVGAAWESTFSRKEGTFSSRISTSARADTIPTSCDSSSN